jgi:hypothetical protein
MFIRNSAEANQVIWKSPTNVLTELITKESNTLFGLEPSNTRIQILWDYSRQKAEGISEYYLIPMCYETIGRGK